MYFYFIFFFTEKISEEDVYYHHYCSCNYTVSEFDYMGFNQVGLKINREDYIQFDQGKQLIKEILCDKGGNQYRLLH